MLAAGAAEAVQAVFGDIIAALHGNLLDGVGHVLHGDAQKAFRHLLGADRLALGGGHFLSQFPEPVLHRCQVQRLIAVGTENGREVAGLDLAEHQVAVGHGQGAAAPVAGRPRIGPGGFRPHPEAGAVELQDRAAAGRYGVDVHHGRPHAHPGHQGLEAALVLPVVVGHVRGGAAHVEADQLGNAAHGGGAGHAHHAAGGAGKNGVLALEQAGVGEAAVGLHEHELRAVALPFDAQLVGHLLHIAAQDGGKVGIDHRGVAPGHQLDQGAGLMAQGDLREADPPAQLSHPQLMVRASVAVHEGHRHRPNAAVEGLLKIRLNLGFVQGGLYPALGVHPLIHFDGPLVEQFRQQDVQGEQIRASLIADAQAVAKALGGDEQGAIPLALQQGVGGHGGAHLDMRDAVGGDGRPGWQAQEVADALHSRVLVALRVFGEQLVADQLSIRALGHQIGEGAAPVNPNLPHRPSAYANPNVRPARLQWPARSGR